MREVRERPLRRLIRLKDLRHRLGVVVDVEPARADRPRAKAHARLGVAELDEARAAQARGRRERGAHGVERDGERSGEHLRERREGRHRALRQGQRREPLEDVVRREREEVDLEPLEAERGAERVAARQRLRATIERVRLEARELTTQARALSAGVRLGPRREARRRRRAVVEHRQDRRLEPQAQRDERAERSARMKRRGEPRARAAATGRARRVGHRRPAAAQRTRSAS